MSSGLLDVTTAAAKAVAAAQQAATSALAPQTQMNQADAQAALSLISAGPVPAAGAAAGAAGAAAPTKTSTRKRTATAIAAEASEQAAAKVARGTVNVTAPSTAATDRKSRSKKAGPASATGAAPVAPQLPLAGSAVGTMSAAPASPSGNIAADGLPMLPTLGGGYPAGSLPGPVASQITPGLPAMPPPTPEQMAAMTAAANAANAAAGGVAGPAGALPSGAAPPAPGMPGTLPVGSSLPPLTGGGGLLSASPSAYAVLVSSPAPYFDSKGMYCSEPDPFGAETPSALRFGSFEQLDDFVKLLGLRNGFRHVLRRSHKDENGEYKHGTYVCEFHAPPTDNAVGGDKPARASSRSIRLGCPYKINFARQGDKVPGLFHVNKRVMCHSHMIEPAGGLGALSLGMPGGPGAMPPSFGMPPMGVAMAPGAVGMGAPWQLPAGGASGASSGAGGAAALQAAMASAAAAAGGKFPGVGVPGVPAGKGLTTLLRRADELLASSAEPVTEMTNTISVGCDNLDSTSFLRALREVDSQLFSGFSSYAGVLDEPVLAGMESLVSALSAVMTRRIEGGKGCRVIVSGCGTSGRMAWAVTQGFNSVFAKIAGSAAAGEPLFHYLCAGGDRALLLSESDIPEDDAARGRLDLAAALQGQAHVVFIGVSAGLAAPYIAGQIDHCLDVQVVAGKDTDAESSVAGSGAIQSLHAALIGFTPATTARSEPIERWSDARVGSVWNFHQTGAAGNSFRTLIARLESTQAAAAAAAASSAPRAGATSGVSILTPVVGPEFVTGSTRLKCGSATKILLESALACALSKSVKGASAALAPEVERNLTNGTVKSALAACMLEYERALRLTYMAIPQISSVLDLVSASLAPPVPAVPTPAAAAAAANGTTPAAVPSPAPAAVPEAPTGGRVLYLAFGPAALRMAFVDASEMNDTFGNGFDVVRAFGLGGIKGSVHDVKALEPAAIEAAHAASGAPGASGSAAATAHLFNVSLTAFQSTVLPTLGAKDTVIALFDSEPVVAPKEGEDAHWTPEQSAMLLQAVRNSAAKVAMLQVTAAQPAVKVSVANKAPNSMPAPVHPVLSLLPKSLSFDASVSIRLPSSGLLSTDGSLVSFVFKSLLNALSTGGHCRAGFVLGNRMINLSLTNSKLFSRAGTLVAELTGVSPYVAEMQLLRALYEVDQVTPELRERKVADHLARASGRPSVVPLALLLAECEATRGLMGPGELLGMPPGSAPGAGGVAGPERPAISVQQAAGQLQQRTFPQIMRRKYGVDNAVKPERKASVTGGAAPAAAAAVAPAGASAPAIGGGATAATAPLHAPTSATTSSVITAAAAATSAMETSD